ncbi:MAG: DUF5924 family protein [Polyangiaceae bacterium]
MKGSRPNEWLSEDRTVPTPEPTFSPEEAAPAARRSPARPAPLATPPAPPPVNPALPDPALLAEASQRGGPSPIAHPIAQAAEAPATPRVAAPPLAPAPAPALQPHTPPRTERMVNLGVAAAPAKSSSIDPSAFATPPPLHAPPPPARSAAEAPRPMASDPYGSPSLDPALGPSQPIGSGGRGVIPGEDPPSRFAEIKEIFREFLHRHEKKIWWLHTTYALSLGAFVATFAQKGFERARMLTLSLGAAWLLVVFFFRFFGTGARQDFMTAWPGMRRRFFIMSYFMKNLFQGMLFFQLPFYYKTVSLEAKNYYVFALLAACAILSTLDLVFDRVLLRFKSVASAFFAMTLFGCANLVIPALLPDTPVIVTLLLAAGLSIATFILFHVSLDSLRKPVRAGVFAGLILVGVIMAYVFRRSMPPVPLAMKDGGVGPTVREDGTLAVEVKSIREGSVKELYAVTDIQVVGSGEKLHHIWRRGDKELPHHSADVAAATEKGVVRVASRLDASDLPSEPIGKYYVDVETESGQIIARVVFEIKAK